MDTCGLERVERFRINLNEKNFASLPAVGQKKFFG
jgi:hypothetical protein